jgi:hypothetical protein
MKATSNRENDQPKNHDHPMSEFADRALKNYEQALHTSLKLQEEAGRWWSSMFNRTSFAQDWQERVKNVTGMTNNLMPLAQRRMQDVIDLMEKNSRTSAELVKKAVDAAQTAALAESQAKWLDFWTTSMGAVRSNTEAVSEISSRTIDSWVQFVKHNSESADPRGTNA